MALPIHDLSSLYQKRFNYHRHYREEVWKILCHDYFSRMIDPKSVILDLGAGWGEFINHIHASQKYAMDFNPDTQKYLHQDIVFFQQDCTQVWPLDDESLDIIFTSNFLEHLPDKPAVENVMNQAFRCLKRDGRLICIGPNIKYLNGAYWDYWDHLIPLTDSSLSELLRLKGFEIQLCIPAFLPYSMTTGLRYPLFLIRLYLRLPFLWFCWGKQFLIIGRKSPVSE